MKTQKAYSIEEKKFEELVRLAASQNRSPANMAETIILERLALCEAERRATGQTSLIKKEQDHQHDNEIENMPLFPIS